MSVVGALLILEIGLQTASLFLHNRNSAWRDGAEVKVLSVGDSHTYGLMVPPDKSYPARLQQLLDEEAPGRYSVVNLGVPGMGTSQVLAALPKNLGRLDPDIVIVWCGVNNAWNTTTPDEDTDTVWTKLHAFGLNFRSYKLLSVALHNEELDAGVELKGDGQRQEVTTRATDEGVEWTLNEGEAILNERGDKRTEEEAEQRSYEDYVAMAKLLKADGVDVVFISYPMDDLAFRQANRALARVEKELQVPLVRGQDALARVPPAQVKWLPGSHPNPPIYREIARDVAPVVRSLRP
jgi:lysophospholipase L1-like esterase